MERETQQTVLLARKDVDHTKFQTEEKEFYEMQCLPSRSGYISDKIDTVYAEAIQERQERREEEIEEIPDIMQGEEDTDDADQIDMDVDTVNVINDSIINKSLNRSGLIRITADEEEVATKDLPCPEIRSDNGGRLLTEKIKITCACVAVKSRISAESVRIASS